MHYFCQHISAVPVAIPSISHYSLNKTELFKKKSYLREGNTCLKNVNISIDSLFFERWGLITATMSANQFSLRASARYTICMHIPLQLWDHIFQKIMIQCLIYLTNCYGILWYYMIYIVSMIGCNFNYISLYWLTYEHEYLRS